MKIALLTVGKVRGLLAEPVGEFEGRIRRYFAYSAIEVKEALATQGRSPERVMAEEGRRLLAKVPAGYELVALDRQGAAWSSEELARYLDDVGMRAAAGVAFVIGGAFGLSLELLGQARRRFSLSALTLPHELARLILVEQLYRAGTILRGEPYHKGMGV